MAHVVSMFMPAVGSHETSLCALAATRRVEWLRYLQHLEEGVTAKRAL